MANNRQGPRQPLAQRRPKVASRSKAVAATKPSTLTARKPAAKKLPVSKPAKPRAKQLPPADPATLYDGLLALYPNAHCELDFTNPFQLAVATILSAQCTDKRVNMVTPVLFAKYPTPESLARAKQEDVEEIIKSTGFFRNKAKSIIGMAGAVADKHSGKVPSVMDDLVLLPGIGRKTANVVLGNAFNINEGVVVDTHIARLSNRLGLTRESDPVKIEQELMKLFPRDNWTMLAHLLIWHGRRVCDAKKPRCGECTLAPMCPSRQL
jgi:endonuclease-3